MTLPLHIPFILAISLLFCPPTTANQVLRLPISGTLQEQQLLEKFEFFTTLDNEVPQNDAALPLVQSEISSYMDIQYFVDLQFGTIGQGFRVLVDTGSSWLWIPGDIFKGTKFTNKYPCREENGCTILENKTRALRYGEGLVHGLLTKDQVCLSNSQSCAVGQSFLLVVDQTDFGGIEGDGILGLSIKDQVDGIPMFLATLKEQGVIKEKVFSLYLEGKHKQGVYHGELILGGVSQDVVGNNQIVYEDVVNTKFWSVGLQGVQIVSQGAVVSQWKHDYQALIDSGTSCLHVPNDQYEQFMSDLETIAEVSLALSASEIKYYDCRLDIMDKFPTIEIFFSDTTFQLKPDDYILEKGNNCFVMFQPSPVSNIWVFGDVFMHRVHTIFDLDRKRIGFVQDSQAQSKVLTQGEYVMLGLVGMIFGLLVFFGTAGWGLMSLIRKLKVKSSGEGVEKMIEIASAVVGGGFNNSSYEKNTI